MHSLPVLGWRETIALPEFGLPAIPAKIDTGARTSALHATHIELVESGGVALVRFRIALGDGDETPVCNDSGATAIPRVTRSVTIASVKGRPALGISALPGSRANTVWYALIG